MTREEEVIMEVEANFEEIKENKPTLLTTSNVDTETKRYIRSFVADLAGIRNQAKGVYGRELVRTFVEYIFKELCVKVEKSPYNKFYVAALMNVDEGDKDVYPGLGYEDIKNLHTLFSQPNMGDIINEVNAAISDYNLTIEKVYPRYLVGKEYIEVGIRFND